jgi:hypothetical protein
VRGGAWCVFQISHRRPADSLSHSLAAGYFLSMPELPEVEVLVRHLAPLLIGRTIRAVRVNRTKVLAGTSARRFARALLGVKFCGLARRGKHLLFELRRAKRAEPLILSDRRSTGEVCAGGGFVDDRGCECWRGD